MYDHHELLATNWPHANGSGNRNTVGRLSSHLNRYRSDRSRVGADDVHATAFDPQPTGRVEVSHIARSVPHPTVRGARPSFVLRAPQVVVPIGDPRRNDQHLARRSARHCLHREIGVEAQRRDGDLHLGHRKAHADSAPGTRVNDGGEIDIGNRQTLSHAIRRMQFCRGAQRCGCPQRGNGDRSTGGEYEANATETRVATCRSSIHVGQRSGGGEHDGGFDGRNRRCQRPGSERARHGDVNIWDRRRNTERRAVQRKRREGRNQSVGGGNAVGTSKHIALRRHLGVTITNALGRTRGARCVEHGGRVVPDRSGRWGQARLGQRPECAHRARNASVGNDDSLRSASPTQHACGGERLRLTNDP